MGQIDIDPLGRAGQDGAVIERKSGFQGKGSQLLEEPLQAIVPIDELPLEPVEEGVLGIDPGEAVRIEEKPTPPVISSTSRS